MTHALSKLPVRQLTNCGTFHRGGLPLLQSVEARAACSWRLPAGLERPARVVADSCAITLGGTTRVATKSPAVFGRGFSRGWFFWVFLGTPCGLVVGLVQAQPWPAA